MKNVLIIFLILIINGCSLYYGQVFDRTSDKIKLIEKIAENPSKIDSLIRNFGFYSPEISKNIFSNDYTKSELIEYLNEFKGKKLILHTNKKFEMDRYLVKYDYSTGYSVLFHEIGFLYEDTDKGLIAVYEFKDSNWFLLRINKTDKYNLKLRYEHEQ